MTEAPAGARGVVPYWLQVAGGWAWRLLFIGVALYVLYRVAGRLALVVIPCAGALLLTALLQPLTSRLNRAGLPMLAATWCTLLGAVILLAGTITLVTIRVRAEYKGLVTQVRHTSGQIETWLAGPPLHLKTTSLQASSNKLVNYLGQHKSLVAGTVLTGGQIAFEVLGGIVLMLFVTFFLIKDGAKIWAWLIRAFGPDGSQRANRAGRAAWQAVVSYVRGTVLVAAIHAVVIGSTLTIMSVPLVAPLAVLVFLAAFIPLVGILFAGTVVILITLVAKGWIAAVILLGVFLAENQLESHLLQPPGRRAHHPAPSARDHPGARRGRHRGRYPGCRGGRPGGRGDHPRGPGAAAALPGAGWRPGPWRPGSPCSVSAIGSLGVRSWRQHAARRDPASRPRN